MTDRRSALQMERRRILKSLAIATVAKWPAPAAGTGLKGTAINHVSYASADYRKTRDFYRDVLGFQVSDEDDRREAANSWIFGPQVCMSSAGLPAAASVRAFFNTPNSAADRSN